MLPHAIAFVNGKGGVGKTSVTANMAGLISHAGYKVLAVDMDTQGNLSKDLGYDDRTDSGQGLVNAVVTKAPLVPLRDVRPGLDVICGGRQLEDMVGLLGARAQRGESTSGVVRDQLARIAGEYHLVLIDCPPGNRQLQHMALAAAHYVVIPTKSDEASLEGLVEVATLFTEIRQRDNPALELLGVVLFGIGSASSRIKAQTRATVGKDLGDPDFVFTTTIRHVEAAADDCRRRGQLAHELERDAADEKKSRLARLRQRKTGSAIDIGDALAGSASGLAEDYSALAQELTGRFSARATQGASA